MQEEKQRNENQKKQKRDNSVGHLNSNIWIISLNVNGLDTRKTETDRARKTKTWFNKKLTSSSATDRLKANTMQTLIHKKQEWLHYLINFKAKKTAREKGLYTTIKETIHSEDTGCQMRTYQMTEPQNIWSRNWYTQTDGNLLWNTLHISK